MLTSPDMTAEAQAGRAQALVALGRKSEAIALLRSALAVAPDRLEWHCSLGALLADAGRHDESIQAGEEALSIDPDCALALFNQATSYLAVGNAAAARDRLERCARLTPDDARVHNNLGLAWMAEGRPESALESYGTALQLSPNYLRALNNRAAAWMRLARFEAALSDLDRAIELQPGYVNCLLNRGASLRALGRPATALESYRAAFPHPDALAAAVDLLIRDLRRPEDAWVCASDLYRLHGERDDASGTYHAVSQGLARWEDFDARVAAIIGGVRAGRRPSGPFRFLYVSDSPADQLACARAAATALPVPQPLYRGESRHHQRIRIGYLSADFYSHATAYLAAGLFERHDRGRFECFAFSHGSAPAADPMRRRLQTAFEHFEDVEALGTGDVARRIRDCEIDILVDLKGYTTGSRIEVLTHRAAPIQVHYLGYPGTLGASFVDYLIADSHVIPPSDDRHYAEKIVRMPHSYQVTDDRREAGAAGGTRRSAGLPETGLVLAAFHQTYKLTPAVYRVWMQLLERLPAACLWVLAREPGARARLIREATDCGIDPSRIVFAAEVSQADHLARLRLADLLLDTWPYGAHTTASDALWMGLPVVALGGASFAARVSGSVLRAAGLAELITHDLEDYRALILQLCQETGRLARLRQRIEAQVRNSPLFDTARFTRALETAYEHMWERHAAGLPPAAFDIGAAGPIPIP